jgi:hypothetical protein
MLAWMAVATAANLASTAQAADGGAAAVMAYDLAITNNSNLEFGVIVPTDTAGAVKMTPTGSRSVLPLGACQFLEIAPLRGAAGFEIVGPRRRSSPSAFRPLPLTSTAPAAEAQ